jgi:hypothetical protein
LNADGTLDIALTSIQSKSVMVLPGVGDGTFGPVTENLGTQSVSSLVLGDVNNDGAWDIVTAPNGDLAQAGSVDSSFVSVFLGDGSGKFAAPKLVAGGEDCLSVALGDVDHDGNLDLARLNSRSDTVSILLGNGDGTFRTTKEYVTGAAPVFVTFAELNHDGQLDLLIADSASNQVSVLLGLDGGEFGLRAVYPTGANPRHLSVADLNGDHQLDLITANVSDFGVSVLQGMGDGTFASKVDFSAAADFDDRPAPQATAVDDLNGDGAPDFVVATSRSNGALPSGVLVFLAVTSP